MCNRFTLFELGIFRCCCRLPLHFPYKTLYYWLCITFTSHYYYYYRCCNFFFLFFFFIRVNVIPLYGFHTHKCTYRAISFCVISHFVCLYHCLWVCSAWLDYLIYGNVIWCQTKPSDMHLMVLFFLFLRCIRNKIRVGDVEYASFMACI